jgi:hypothetical protein
MAAALDRSKRNGIDHQPRLEARLDREQAADFPQHYASSAKVKQ